MKIVKATLVGGLFAALLMTPGVRVLAHDHSDLRIPPGHLPPPGKCRIWYPGKAPGHQPRPGDCRTLSRQVPRGAYLVGHDKKWRYDDLRDHHYTRDAYDGRSYSNKREIRQDVRDVRESRQDVREDRQELESNHEELRKDRAELRRDIRDGASKKEIRRDRREIREDMEKIAESKRELNQSERKLEAAREELREDLRRR